MKLTRAEQNIFNQLQEPLAIGSLKMRATVKDLLAQTFGTSKTALPICLVQDVYD